MYRLVDLRSERLSFTSCFVELPKQLYLPAFSGVFSVITSVVAAVAIVVVVRCSSSSSAGVVVVLLTGITAAAGSAVFATVVVVVFVGGGDGVADAAVQKLGTNSIAFTFRVENLDAKSLPPSCAMSFLFSLIEILYKN